MELNLPVSRSQSRLTSRGFRGTEAAPTGHTRQTDRCGGGEALGNRAHGNDEGAFPSFPRLLAQGAQFKVVQGGTKVRETMAQEFREEQGACLRKQNKQQKHQIATLCKIIN